MTGNTQRQAIMPALLLFSSWIGRAAGGNQYEKASK